MANITLSPGTRQMLGQRFCDWIQAGLGQKGTGPSGWWREVTGFHENRVPESPGKDIVPWHVPIAQPRQDSLSANVCTVIAKQEPVMLCDIEDTDLADRRQKFIHKAWNDAGIEVQLRKASNDAADINKCFFKVTPRPERAKRSWEKGASSGAQRSPGATHCPGAEIAVIKPNDMSVYPAVLGGCQEAVLAGNRLWKTVGSCKALIKSGIYYKKAMEPSEGDPAQNDELGTKARAGSIENLSPDLDTRGTEIWDCVVTYDLSLVEGCEDAPKGINRYRATLAKATNELLALELYPPHFRHIWFFESFYIPDGENYWGARSVGRDLKALQDAYNKLAATFYTYALAAARPQVFGPPLPSGEQYTRTEAYDYIETDESTQAFSPSVTFQGQPLVVQMQQIERIADMVASVSQNTMGSVQGRSTTATTDSIIAAGVSVGLEEKISNFSTPLPAMAEHTEDVLAGMWAEITPYYTRQIPGQDGAPPQSGPLLTLDELAMPCTWSCNGMSPAATPTARVQAAMQLVELAQDPEYGINKYALGTVIAKDSPLSGSCNVQLPRDQVDAKVQAQQQAEQAAANPPPKITDILDSKMVEILGLTEMEKGQLIQLFGMQPDPRRATGELDALRGQQAATDGGQGGEGGNAQPTADPGGGGSGGAGPHDAALDGAMASPELQQIASQLAAGGGGRVLPPGSAPGDGAPG